jgi:hypothetical protein
VESCRKVTHFFEVIWLIYSQQREGIPQPSSPLKLLPGSKEVVGWRTNRTDDAIARRSTNRKKEKEKGQSGDMLPF